MDPTQGPHDDDHDFASDAVLGRRFPTPRPLRSDLQAAHARSTAELSAIDAQLEALLGRRTACLRALEPLRTRLNRRWTHHHVRRHARVDEPAMPPAPPDAVPLEGTALREVCTTLLRRHGPQRLRDLHALLHRYGYTVGGARPVQRLGDAMAYEVRCGRAVRVERGVYAGTGEGLRRVRRAEDVSGPAPVAPLPWRAPVTDPAPPLLDPAVLADPQHWGADEWPADDHVSGLDGTAETTGTDPTAVAGAAPADDPERTGRSHTPPDPTDPAALVPSPTPLGDDSSTNRPRGGSTGGEARAGRDGGAHPGGEADDPERDAGEDGAAAAGADPSGGPSPRPAGRRALRPRPRTRRRRVRRKRR